MSRKAIACLREEKLLSALPEEPEREARRDQRCKVAEAPRGMFRPNSSEGEGIADFRVDAEIQRNRGAVTGSFDKIPNREGPFAVGIAKMPDLYSRKDLQVSFSDAVISSSARAFGIAVRLGCVRV